MLDSKLKATKSVASIFMVPPKKKTKFLFRLPPPCSGSRLDREEKLFIVPERITRSVHHTNVYSYGLLALWGLKWHMFGIPKNRTSLWSPLTIKKRQGHFLLCTTIGSQENARRPTVSWSVISTGQADSVMERFSFMAFDDPRAFNSLLLEPVLLQGLSKAVGH